MPIREYVRLKLADHCNWKNLTVCTNSQVGVTKVTFNEKFCFLYCLECADAEKLFHETFESSECGM